MKNVFLTGLIGLFLAVPQSYAQLVKFYYPDSTVASEGTLREGKPDGFWKTYYPNGVIKSAGLRTQFQLDSVWAFFYQNGDTSETIQYRMGKKNGFYQKFQQSTEHVKNLPIAKELWLNDLRNGLAQYFHPGGELQMEVRFEEGLKQGEAKVYDETGKIIAINLYRNDFLVFSERINRIDMGGLKQGVWREFHPNGKLAREMNYRNNRLHGYVRIYDERGKLLSAERYDDGEVVIEKIDKQTAVRNVKETFPSGATKYLRTFQGDKQVGIQREFDESGKVVASEVYNQEGILSAKGIVEMNGRRNGDWKNLNSDGSVRSEGKYVNGLQSGKWTFYYPNGKVEQLGVYQTGKFSGFWQWFYPTGQLWKEENYENAELEGLYTEFTPQGEVIVKGKYIAGMKQGSWRIAVGDQIEEGSYLDDERDGEWKFYYPDGTLKADGAYSMGALTGTHHLYHENGKIKELRNYRLGKEHGRWVKYDENGLQILELEYERGELKKIDGIPVEN